VILPEFANSFSRKAEVDGDRLVIHWGHLEE
jgi:hypothetical protein